MANQTLNCVDITEERTETAGIWYTATMDDGRKFDVQHYPPYLTLHVERNGRALSRISAPNIHIAICKAFKAMGLMQ